MCRGPARRRPPAPRGPSFSVSPSSSSVSGVVRVGGDPGLRLVSDPDYSASMTEKPRTPALQEAAKRRQTLHEALVGLEFAISSPAAGRIPAGANLVTKEVTAVRDAWDQHVDTTEKPGGLYEEIVGISPRLAGTIDRLRGEHPHVNHGRGHQA